MTEEILSPKEKKELDRLWEKQYGKLEDWLKKKPRRINKKKEGGKKWQ
ncbi:unnamed protein product [marine sediment metagenome]|uniref:Uncharacterized protein n=1 Tax=marine sediment metagenome TaxID=412755 RepID=X1F959_9ZZZZ